MQAPWPFLSVSVSQDPLRHWRCVFFTSYKTIGFVLGRELRTKERKERFVETNKSLNRSKDTVISSVHHIALNNDNQGDSKWSFGLVGHWAFLEGRLTIPKTSKTNCQDGWCVFCTIFYIYIYVYIYMFLMWCWILREALTARWSKMFAYYSIYRGLINGGLV